MKITKGYLRELIKESLYETGHDMYEADEEAGSSGGAKGVPSNVLFPMLDKVKRAEQELRRVEQTISYLIDSAAPDETIEFPPALMKQLKKAEDGVVAVNAEFENLFK